MTDKIILPSSPEAAEYKTVTGWVSRQGVFYGENEKSARSVGSTHNTCVDCATVTAKTYVRCSDCIKKQAVVRHAEREREKWDGKTPLYSHVNDEYLYDWDDVLCPAYEALCSLEDLQLVICKPVYLRPIDDDEWYDELPEDGELPKAVGDALDALNKTISEAEPVAWRPGPVAVDVAQLETEK